MYILVELLGFDAVIRIMKSKFIYSFLLLVLFSFGSIQLLSQDYSVSGRILNEQGEEVPYATITALEPSDSSLVKGTLSDDNGMFQIELAKGTYLIKINFLSYQEHSELVEVSNKIKLNNIILKEDIRVLEEVEVRAEKSQLTMKLDKRIFNVGRDLTSRGGNASDILDNIPSVNVDVEGNVSLRGSNNIKILIDGKESAMVSDGGAFLRQLPANMIKQVEVITNPSARYQADGEAGIINIVLQKNNEKKYNGSIEASIGDPANHSLSYILNWRGEKIGINSSYGLQYRKFRGSGSIKQDFFDSSIEDYNSTRAHQRGGLNHNFRLGLDWYINPKNTVALIGLFNPRTADNGANIDYTYFEVDSPDTYWIARDDDEREEARNIEFSLSHTKKLDKKDHKWTNLISLNRRDDEERNVITETTSLKSDVLYQYVNNREDAQTLVLQSDYVKPFGKEGKFETGVRGSFRRIENEFLVREALNDGVPGVLENFDNLFKYDEDIYAAYFMAGNKINRWSYQAGLRVEHSEISTELVKTMEKNPRSYTNLFPSGLINYEMDSLNSFQLSYSRRITRPRLWSLFPFFTFSDNRNLASGNPDLDPELTNSMELAWLKKHEGGNIMAALVYRRSIDVIERISQESEDGIIRSFPVNISTRDAYGVELNASFRPKEWWKISAGTYFAYEELSGQYESISLETYYFNSESRLSTEFDITKDIDFQISYRYDSPFNTPQGRRLSINFVQAAISKKFWNNKASLTLNVSDLFNTRFRRSEISTDRFDQESEFQWRQRQLILTFNYRIGKENNSRSRGRRPSM